MSSKNLVLGNFEIQRLGEALHAVTDAEPLFL